MNFIPKSLLKKLYTRGSLTKANEGFTFNIKNRLIDVHFEGLSHLSIEGSEIQKDQIFADLGDGKWLSIEEINKQNGFGLKLGKSFNVLVVSQLNGAKNLDLSFKFDTKPFGKLSFSITDQVNAHKEERAIKIPRIHNADYGKEAIKERQEFVQSFSGSNPKNISNPIEDTTVYQGNIEHLTGFAKIPMGIAGPIKVNGEHAQGEYLVPLATTEGTLVASYNKGIKLVNEVGGVNCRVIQDSMQRAPVFIFDTLIKAVDFGKWIKTVSKDLKAQAEIGSNHLKYDSVEVYQAGNNVFLRFNFFTGDAAGQNMVNKATFQICQWILEVYDGVQHFFLESNMASDKKHSFINSLNSRGKRVIAEVTFPEELLVKNFGVDAHQLQRHLGVANLGGMMAGVNNNGLHTANALAAMFIAFGQDVANLAESTAGFLHTEVLADGSLYGTVTLPSLIVGTVGGGTALPTQRDCLEMVGCYGSGKAKKLAEIMAGVVLAGEISLGAAISSLDWVAAHEDLGRNSIP
ncbi:hydroxymethylglutaryl-CoA reductase [Roseivirga sp.]|uniref:hydroxymethylglutaryl-CoA reductase n=1 Tax=Roseivirga sp. TaxID=1964215 RepID=UPI003B8AAD94